MDYTCTVCDRVLQPHASGAESSLTGHSAIRHVRCTACHTFYTPQRLGEHKLLYHTFPCELCASRFTSAANLLRHKSRIHRRYTCPLCPQSHDGRSYNGVADLQTHVHSAHPGQNVYHCRQCSKVFTTSANLARHVAIVHSKECVYCCDDEEVDGGARRPKFATDAQLRQHIVTTHNHNVCHFCGGMFRSAEGLYRHQVDHCRNRYKCVSCDREFNTSTRLNAHMASYGSDIGACSTHTTPSLARHMQLWNLLPYRHKPWKQDVTHILGTGRVQSEISDHYRRVRGRRAATAGAATAAGSDRHDDDAAALRTRAYEHVRDNYIDQLREAYRSNLRQYVNHTTVKDGHISRITVNLLDKRGFFDQVETALRKIFNICRYMVPYNMLLAFGSLLYKMRTKEIEQFFVVDHLQRDPERRAIVNQVPNIWLIRTVADEDCVISDIRQTDFFDLLRDRMESEQYNFKILRMTHMTAEIFPAVDCNIHNSVVGSQQYVGRGFGDSSSSDEEDDIVRDCNLFILDEAEVDTDDEDSDTTITGKDAEHLIRKYVQFQCRSRKLPVLVSLKTVLAQHHPSRCGAQTKYKKLCFFAQVARWRLLCDTGVASDDDIHDKTDEYYELYKRTYNIASDELFEGVHISILHFLEYIFKLRINVYEIHSLKQATTQQQQQNNAFVDKYYPVIQPLFISTSSPHVYTAKTLHLLLHDNHYYTISDVHKLMNLHYRCILCGTQFTGHKLSSFKRHILNRCGKIRYQYRRGVVDTHENMWEEAKRVFSIPDDIMLDSRRYTSIYATFDFESMLVKEDVSDAEYFSQTRVLGIDDDGTECTEQDYMERHKDEQYITVNTPLSYAIACNIRSDDDMEFTDRLQQQHDDDDIVSVAYGVNDNPEQLIQDFVATLMTIA